MGKPAMERSPSNWFQSSEAGGGAAQILSGAENYKSPALLRLLGLWKTFHNLACSFTLPSPRTSPRTSRKQKMPEKEDQEKQFGGFSFLCGYLPFLFWSVCVLVVCMCVHIWVCTWWRVCVRALVCAWMQGVGIGVSVIALHVSLLQLSLCCCAETLTKTSFGEEIKAGAQDGNLKQEPRRDATL